MNIFKHNYHILSDEDKKYLEDWEKWKKKRFQSEPLIGFIGMNELSLWAEKIHKNQALQHYFSLFPNNFLCSIDYQKNHKAIYRRKLAKFSKLLDKKDIGERQILNHIRATESYFIISSILKSTNYGHHSAYIFPEFPLATAYKSDYLVIGKGSDGHHLIFVELENPYQQITKKDGSFGHTIRKGILQVEEWEAYLEKNYSQIANTLKPHKHPDYNLPEEFYHFDSTRISFVVVAGRRNDFNEKTYRQKRKTLKRQGLYILHYDNLIDLARISIEHGIVG